jgi:hypothetical protein
MRQTMNIAKQIPEIVITGKQTRETVSSISI